MATDRHKINIKLIDIERYFADGLCSICMEEYFVSPTNLSNFFDWLDHAYLVVHHYNRNYYRVRSYCLLKFLQVDQSICLDRQVSHIKALLFQVTAAIKHAFMIDLSSDYMFLIRVLLVKLSDSFQCQVITLCSTTCKDDFFR